MAHPKVTAHATVPPLTDPNDVREVFAHDMIVNVRNDVMHITFNAVRPTSYNPITGQTAEEQVVTGRVVMSLTTASAMADCIRQTLTAITTHKEMAQLN